MIAYLPEAKVINTEACEKIKIDTYVDDTLTGGTKRFIRVKDGQTGEYSGTILQILSVGIFGVNGMIRNGEIDQEMEDLLGNTTLG